MEGNDYADRLAGKGALTSGLLLGRSDVLRSLRRYLRAQDQEHSFSLYIAAFHMAHVLVYYTMLVVIIICIMFVKLRKCWRML